MAEKHRKAAPRPAAALPPLHNLLHDPIFTVREGVKRTGASLPEVLHRLGARRVSAFPALQAYQQHAWHAFLVQLAAMALHRAGESSCKLGAARWEELLLDMTDGEVEPWCLVVDELDKAAFMQPPVPERSLVDFKRAGVRPDLADVLVLARNHDVKMGRIWSPASEHWALALVSLQTMQGVLGAGKYGIARMNRGYGSRPGIGFAPRDDLGARFERDVRRLLADRPAVLRAVEGYEDSDARCLLWLDPWNGKKSASLDGLDPYFIEVCRRVRLARDGDRLIALTLGTDAPRLAAEELRGATGDPWTPVDKAENTAFTASSSGFSYRILQRLLGDEYTPGIALQPARGEKEVTLVAEVLARGQGQTNGYHRRTLPVPPPVLRLMGSEEGRRDLGSMARQRVEAAADVQNGVLRPALLCLFQGDPEKPRKLDFKDERPRRWLEAFDGAVDAQFFERLWADLDESPAEARTKWERWLLDQARQQLRRAIEVGPIPSARHYRAIAGGERTFGACERSRFRHLFDREGEHA